MKVKKYLCCIFVFLFVVATIPLSYAKYCGSSVGLAAQLNFSNLTRLPVIQFEEPGQSENVWGAEIINENGETEVSYDRAFKLDSLSNLELMIANVSSEHLMVKFEISICFNDTLWDWSGTLTIKETTTNESISGSIGTGSSNSVPLIKGSEVVYREGILSIPYYKYTGLIDPHNPNAFNVTETTRQAFIIERNEDVACYNISINTSYGGLYSCYAYVKIITEVFTH